MAGFCTVLWIGVAWHFLPLARSWDRGKTGVSVLAPAGLYVVLACVIGFASVNLTRADLHPERPADLALRAALFPPLALLTTAPVVIGMWQIHATLRQLDTVPGTKPLPR